MFQCIEIIKLLLKQLFEAYVYTSFSDSMRLSSVSYVQSCIAYYASGIYRGFVVESGWKGRREILGELTCIHLECVQYFFFPLSNQMLP